MNEPYEDRHQWHPQAQWPPSPFVTHETLAPIHKQIGALEQGQQSIIQTYSHLRGEMLHGFDEMKALLRAEKVVPPPSSPGITLTTSQLIVFITALVLAGILLSRIPGVENLIGS